MAQKPQKELKNRQSTLITAAGTRLPDEPPEKDDTELMRKVRQMVMEMLGNLDISSIAAAGGEGAMGPEGPAGADGSDGSDGADGIPRTPGHGLEFRSGGTDTVDVKVGTDTNVLGLDFTDDAYDALGIRLTDDTLYPGGDNGDSGLQTDSDGLKIKVKANAGITMDGDGIWITIGDGLKLVDNTLQLNYNASHFSCPSGVLNSDLDTC